MEEGSAASSNSRMPSSAPASPLEDDFAARSPSRATPSRESTHVADADAPGTLKDYPTSLDQAWQARGPLCSSSGPTQSAEQQGPPPKRVKKDFGGERWTKEEELALLEIRNAKDRASWEETPKKMVAKGFKERSVSALMQRFKQMDGASQSESFFAISRAPYRSPRRHLDPRLVTEQDNSWTDDEVLTLRAIIKHQASNLIRTTPIDWSAWQASFPGKTKYQLSQKTGELRRIEENAKLKNDQRQADKAARDAAVEAKWRSLQGMQGSGQPAGTQAGSAPGMSANGEFFIDPNTILTASSSHWSAPTFASGNDGNGRVPPILPKRLTMPFHSAASSSSHRVDPFVPGPSTTSTQFDAYLNSAIDSALSNDSQLPQQQSQPHPSRPLNPLPRTIFGQASSTRRAQPNASTPRKQQHEPVAAAAVVATALPKRQPVVAGEIAKLVVNALGEEALQFAGKKAQAQADGRRAAKEAEGRAWKTNLGDEEDTSWTPKSERGVELEKRLQEMAKRFEK